MASIISRADGKKYIQILIDKRRSSVWLGDTTQRNAERFRDKIEELVKSRSLGLSIPQDVAAWIAKLPDKMASRLVELKLIDPPQKIVIPTLVEFVDQYIAKRTDTKPGTLKVYGRCRNLLASFFKAIRLDELTIASAKDFARWMRTKKKPLSENTARRMIGFARQFVTDAVESEILVKNPFKVKELKVTVRGDAQVCHSVSIEETAKIIDSCPNAEWRLIVALSRFGGLRTPSETLALRWSDVDWEAKTIRVTSVKTAHHTGHEERIIPLFGELRPFLEDAFNPENEFAITQFRDATQNMRTQFGRIIAKAGLKPWAQPFHAMRKTRQTELNDDFAEHSVCRWLGNSQTTAREFYLKTTEEHHERAVNRDCMQPSMQYGHKSARNDLNPENAENEKAPALQGLTTNADAVPNAVLDDTRLELVTSTMSTWRSNQLS